MSWGDFLFIFSNTNNVTPLEGFGDTFIVLGAALHTTLHTAAHR
jgi:hypothetical protein